MTRLCEPSSSSRPWFHDAEPEPEKEKEKEKEKGLLETEPEQSLNL